MITGGHRFEDIRQYTVDQIALFYAAAIRRRIYYMMDIKAAVWADKGAFDKYIETLGRG